MKTTIHNLLTGIIDYAGLFPPASLSLDEAMKMYIKYLDSNYDWMLSHFVIPHNRLENLYDISAREDELPDPLHLSLVAGPTTSVLEFFEVLENIKTNIFEAHTSIAAKLNTDVLELKLPEEVLKEGDDNLTYVLEKTSAAMAKNKLLPEMIFWEVPGFNYKLEQAKNVIKAIAEHNQNLQSGEENSYALTGFKIRCGGVESHMFPPSDYLAEVISFAAEHHIPFKFTAGLHHPIRMYHDSVQTYMYGFLNVFAAAFIAAKFQPGNDIMEEILIDENSDNFTFNDDEFSWKDYKITATEIAEFRQKIALSVGSCSITEPVEDLQKLKLID